MKEIPEIGCKRFAKEFAELKIKEFIKEIEDCGFIDGNLKDGFKITNFQIVIDRILYK